VLGTLRENPGRSVLAVIAIALGVALGVAVHLVNSSALNEFELAARHLAGEADLVVRGPRAGFDESLYPRLARLPQVEAANPAVDLEVPLSGRQDSLRIVGFDPLRLALRLHGVRLGDPNGAMKAFSRAEGILGSADPVEQRREVRHGDRDPLDRANRLSDRSALIEDLHAGIHVAEQGEVPAEHPEREGRLLGASE